MTVLAPARFYAAIGARAPKGALLAGAPGTGKTLLARATGIVEALLERETLDETEVYEAAGLSHAAPPDHRREPVPLRISA